MAFEDVDGFPSLQLCTLDTYESWSALAAIVGKSAAFERLSQALLTAVAATVVVESDYYDEDHMRSFQRRYARSLWQPDRLCKRLHFFSIRFTTSEFSQWWRQTAAELGSNASEIATNIGYLGYVVARQGYDAPLGRVMLATRAFRQAYKTIYSKNKGIEDVETHIQSESDVEATLCGITLRYKCTPFITADGETGVCASAASWTVLRTLYYKGNFAPWLSLSEITDIANRTISHGHIMPSQGLEASQFCNLFRDANLDPFVRKAASFELPKWNGRQSEMKAYWNWILYALQEGGHPVVLLVRYGELSHALALIGHTYRKRPKEDPIKPYRLKADITGDCELNFCSIAECVEDFIIHDPHLGAYELFRLDLDEQDDSQFSVVLKPQKPFGHLDDRIEHWKIDLVIAATPLEVAFDAPNAEERAIRFWNTEFCALVGAPPSEHVAFRTLLIHNTDFKRFIGSGQAGAPREVITRFRSMQMPKWVYLTEIRNSAETTAGKRDGLILTDATNNSRKDKPILAVYFKNYIFIRSFLDGRPIQEQLKNPENFVTECDSGFNAISESEYS